MILFGKTYDENSVSAKKGMTATWQKRHNPAKSYDNQFGKSYDVNLTFYSGITKRGDGYLRKQLIHGARTVVQHAHKKDDDLNRWITELKARRGINKTVVATAHRLARLMWILLQKNECYTPQFTQKAV